MGAKAVAMVRGEGGAQRLRFFADGLRALDGGNMGIFSEMAVCRFSVREASTA